LDRDWLRCVKETGCLTDAAAVRRRRRCHGPWLPTGRGTPARANHRRAR
jgi:hypothetical protein